MITNIPKYYNIIFDYQGNLLDLAMNLIKLSEQFTFNRGK